MVKIKTTKKLREAISILSGERHADCDSEAYFTALKRGKLNREELYKALASMSYKWNATNGQWVWRPHQMKIIQRIFMIANAYDLD